MKMVKQIRFVFTGLLTSLCMPVFHKTDNTLFGVVCSDLTMSNLVSDITYFQQGENSYSFIIDGRGRTLMHPLLPLPSQFNGDPIYVEIQHLERESDALEVIESMKRLVLLQSVNKHLFSLLNNCSFFTEIVLTRVGSGMEYRIS